MDKTKAQLDKVESSGHGSPPGEAKVADFAELVATMSQLLAGLASIGHFKASSVGLAEWTTLSFIAQSKAPIEKTKVSRSLGLSRDRADQIIKMLKKLDLIQTDGEQKVLSLTVAGREELNKKNARLQELLSNALQKRPHSIANAGKQLQQVSRVLAVEKRARRAGARSLPAQ